MYIYIYIYIYHISYLIYYIGIRSMPYIFIDRYTYLSTHTETERVGLREREIGRGGEKDRVN